MIKYVFFFFMQIQIHNLQLQSCSLWRDTSKSALEFRFGEAEHLEFRFPFQDFFSPDHEVPPPSWSGGAFLARRAADASLRA